MTIPKIGIPPKARLVLYVLVGVANVVSPYLSTKWSAWGTPEEALLDGLTAIAVAIAAANTDVSSAFERLSYSPHEATVAYETGEDYGYITDGSGDIDRSDGEHEDQRTQGSLIGFRGD